MGKTVIGGRKYELKGVSYHSGSLMSGHYTVAVKFKEKWWNCHDAVVKIMEEGKVVSEAAYILFTSKCEVYLKTSKSILGKCAWPPWLFVS